jgi:hypothetical protein
MSLADLIVHLCFPLKKVTIFYQIQSKGGLAFRTHNEFKKLHRYSDSLCVVVVIFKFEIF